MAFLAVNKMEISVKFALWTSQTGAVHIHVCAFAHSRVLGFRSWNAWSWVRVRCLCACASTLAHLVPHAVCVPV